MAIFDNLRNIFGFTLTNKRKKTPTNQSLSRKEPDNSIFPPDNEDGALEVEVGSNLSGIHQHGVIDFDTHTKNESDLIEHYRRMSQQQEVEDAIDDILIEAVIMEEDGPPVEINLDSIDDKVLSDKIKEKVRDEFQGILSLLNFNKKGHDIFRRWYVDGRLYYYMIVEKSNTKKGIREVRMIDPRKIKKVREIEKGRDDSNHEVIKNIKEYYKFIDRQRVGSPTRNEVAVAPDAIAYITSGLFDHDKKAVLSHLHKAIKPMNQLRMLEDSVVIYRLARAPERRAFFVDVGSMPKNKAENYLKSLMNQHKNRLVYDVDSGQISNEGAHLTMTEDFWLPRREGGKGTEITTLQGGQNLGELDDVVFFQKKLYRSLKVPITRIDPERGITLGRSSEITRDELKFSRFISRLRAKFSELFIQMLKVQLVLKRIVTEQEFEAFRNQISFDYAQDSHFAELKNLEIVQERMSQIRDVHEYAGKYFSHQWIRRNILQQTDDDIDQIDKEIAEEATNEQYNPPEDEGARF